MKPFDIRERMLLAALLPVSLVALMLSSVFLMGRIGDIDAAHAQRARMLARQLSSASEYGMFAGNIGNLQQLAGGALRESDVRSVAILDPRGRVLASAGQPGYRSLPDFGDSEAGWNDERTGRDIVVQPVAAQRVPLDELFESIRSGVNEPTLLGHVVLEVSRETLVSHERDMLFTGLFVTIGGLLLGSVLALRIGSSVVRPVLRVSRMIERITHGDLTARVQIQADDPMQELQQGLNQMAARIEQGRDELEQRIEQATTALRRKKEEAETATLAKSRFLAAASHDLRQPTHALGLFVARLGQLPLEAETRRVVDHLDAAVRSLQDLLDGLLDLSRLEAQSVHVSMRAFPMAELLEQLGSALLPMAQQQGLRLRLRPCAAWVHSDPALLYRILLNLIANALRYTREGGVVVACRLRGQGRRLRIEVWDSGIGIAPEHREAIFGEFFQVANAERDRHRGLGLGLSIVDRTARLLGHPIDLCSKLGQGSRFSIELSVAPAQPHSGIERRAVAIRDDIDGLAVLVVEDDRMVSRALQDLLVSWGCRVLVAESLSGALHGVQAGFAPQVVLSDYRLKEASNGVEVIRQLRQALGRDIPACLISGDADTGLVQQARASRLPLLYKPVRPAKLRSLLRRLSHGQAADPAIDQFRGEDLA